MQSLGTAQPIHVQTFLDTQPFSRFPWQIFGLCFLTVLLDGFDTGAVGFVAPSLLKEWAVEKPALAPVLSGALFGLAAGALLAGPLAAAALLIKQISEPQGQPAARLEGQALGH